MIINEVFKNEQEELLDTINSLPKYGCIDNFFKYIYKNVQKDENGNYSLEGLFINKMFKDVDDFIKDIARDHYKALSKEDLVETVIAFLEEGVTSMDCLEQEDLAFSLYDYCTEEEAYPLIKEFMLKTLISIIKERSKNDKEKRINELKNTVTTLSTNIGISQQCLKEAQEELDKLLSEQK